MGVSPVRAAVFLDRDGVINQVTVRDGVSYPPASVDECQLLPGVCEACQMLRRAGYVLIVVTNQPDVVRGRQSREGVEGINAWVRRMLPVHEILTCYHDDADRCTCRKPKPGLLLQAADRWMVDLHRSVMIGDRWSDIQAGRAAGCTSMLIEQEYSHRDRCQPDHIVADLLAAAHIILMRGAPYEDSR
jgi:D-glycero-D-manno-heptose 1,7-bisphosphate phosphatase